MSVVLFRQNSVQNVKMFVQRLRNERWAQLAWLLRVFLLLRNFVVLGLLLLFLFGWINYVVNELALIFVLFPLKRLKLV